MTLTYKITVLAVLAGIVAVVWLLQLSQRGRHRPLAGPPPKAPALGTEAIDHAAFQTAVVQNEEISKRAQNRL
ncbi:hypothetical protein [Gemmobacter caeruleus]|uniref:hypothetical protein n=1 Tax=Gemmobacter caeruleus TaxID=2595004 RepID=UPI0011ED552A|nr:hypothetical protein [Gemmobacter caeruleus]